MSYQADFFFWNGSCPKQFVFNMSVTVFFTLSFLPEVLYSPLVGRYMRPTVVTDISFGSLLMKVWMGILGRKTSKKEVIMLKKGDHPLSFKDLTFFTGPNRWYSSLYDWQLDSSYLGHNVSYICEWRDRNFVPGTWLSKQKCDWPTVYINLHIWAFIPDLISLNTIQMIKSKSILISII